MFEIRELRHLLSLDEFRHFGRAAKAVGLSQPALTKSLQRMELAFGAKLFERSSTRVAPTAIGVEVLARSRQLVADAEELKRTVDSLTGVENGSVAVGIGPAMAESYTAEAIAEVMRKRPQSRIAVRVDNWQQLSAWLLAGEIDFYVADIGEAKIDRRLEYFELPPQRFVWFARRAHPLSRRGKRAVGRNELLSYPIATPKMPAWAVEWFAAALGDQGLAGLPRPFPAVECESYSLLKQLVLNSDCISAALERTLTQELADRSVSILNVDAPELTTRAGIIRMPQRSLSRTGEELVKAIERLANAKIRRGK
ncbi:MAG: LysR family transcriptional regulator [Pirellulales bacterium]